MCNGYTGSYSYHLVQCRNIYETSTVNTIWRVSGELFNVSGMSFYKSLYQHDN